MWSGEGKPTFPLKKIGSPRGGLYLDMELSRPVFPFRNTVVFPFRYKDNRLRALGVNAPVREGEAGHLVHWMVFLEDNLLENREETAKCLRALRRELRKEFPELETAVKQERIVYLPNITEDSVLPVKSLEVFPDVLYLGSELEPEDGPQGLRNLDRTLSNCKSFQGVIQPAYKPAQVDAAPEHSC